MTAAAVADNAHCWTRFLHHSERCRPRCRATGRHRWTEWRRDSSGNETAPTDAPETCVRVTIAALVAAFRTHLDLLRDEHAVVLTAEAASFRRSVQIASFGAARMGRSCSCLLPRPLGRPDVRRDNTCCRSRHRMRFRNERPMSDDDSRGSDGVLPAPRLTRVGDRTSAVRHRTQNGGRRRREHFRNRDLIDRASNGHVCGCPQRVSDVDRLLSVQFSAMAGRTFPVRFLPTEELTSGALTRLQASVNVSR